MKTRHEKEKSKTRRLSARDWASKQEQGFEPTAVRLPEGVELFRVTRTGKFSLDIIPYKVGKGNPDADEGFEHFQRTYHAHWVPGLDGRNRSYVCLARTFKKRCPVCDWLTNNRGQNQNILDSLKIKLRMLWNVIDLDEKDKGVQIFDTAYFRSFGELLKDAIQVSAKYDDFANVEEGYTVQLSVKENKSGFGKFTIARVDLVPRDKQYSRDIINKAHCLDDCLVVGDYEEIKGLLEGKTTLNQPEAPSDTEYCEKDDPIPFEIGSKVKHKRHGVCTVTKVSADGTSLTLKDADGDKHPAINPDEVEAVEEDEDEPEEPSDVEDDEADSDLEDESEDDETDSDLEDEEEDLDEEDEDKPPTKKKKVARR